MRTPDLSYRKIVLVCTNQRDGGRNCCSRRGNDELYPQLKQAVKDACPDVRVSRTGCLGNCLSGGMVVIMPDDVWLGEVTLKDIPEIVNMVK